MALADELATAGSCRDQEGRRGSEEAVAGPSVFPSHTHTRARARALSLSLSQDVASPISQQLLPET